MERRRRQQEEDERRRRQQEEEEKERRRREAEAEAARLLAMIKNLDEEEMERKRRLAAQSQTQEEVEGACAFGDTDLMGLTEAELDGQADELFRGVPVEFVPRANNEVDQAIYMLIKELNINIPILHIKNKLYLIGTNRLSCEIKRDIMMVRVGGGYEKFVEYVPRNQRYFQRMIVVYMIKSGESLEWVIESLCTGRKIKNIIKTEQQDKSKSRSKSRSKEPENDDEKLKRRVAVNLSQTKDDTSMTKDQSPQRGFSFRETSPFSRKRDASPMSIKKQRSVLGNDASPVTVKKVTTTVNHQTEIENMQAEIDYQQKKEVLVSNLKQVSRVAEETTVVESGAAPKKMAVMKTY
mmetsp:Transcript_5424/g.9129  ORF Transcript_5424/g.9129 Transcript_5424/m.9129 type:complete len:352 (-) Transcript_5424:8-1063(-)